ncbi:hypothetical protein BC831DRAFT_242723 [Entophlyctis helioformis]|nr:hypothetical protein BC831DRAFT_242723 [Entophlyctis helioformis]
MLNGTKAVLSGIRRTQLLHQHPAAVPVWPCPHVLLLHALGLNEAPACPSLQLPAHSRRRTRRPLNTLRSTTRSCRTSMLTTKTPPFHRQTDGRTEVEETAAVIPFVSSQPKGHGSKLNNTSMPASVTGRPSLEDNTRRNSSVQSRPTLPLLSGARPSKSTPLGRQDTVVAGSGTDETLPNIPVFFARCLPQRLATHLFSTSAGVKPDKAFMEHRRLGTRFARVHNIWGLVVGFVIPGLYYGFNLGYKYGVGSMMAAHVIASTLVVLLSAMFVDLGTVYTFTSGCAAYSYAAFGGVAATIVGYAYLIEFLMATSSNNTFIAILCSMLFGTADSFEPVYWAVIVVFCVVLNTRPQLYMTVNAISTAFACVYLVCLLCIGASRLDYSRVFHTVMADGSVSTAIFPYGIYGVFNAIPFALYLYIGFEVIPVAAEETLAIETSMPYSMWSSTGTLVTLGTLVVIITAGMPPGVQALSASELPFVDSMSVIFGITPGSTAQKVLIASMIPGIAVPMLNNFFGCSRYVYGLARGGYLPTFLAITSKGNSTGHNRAPVIALVVVGCLVMLASGNMQRMPRPAKSAFGIPGAVLVMIITGGSFGMLMYLQKLWQNLGIAVAIFVACVIPYYIIVIKRNLIETPESLFVRRRIKEHLSDVVNSITASAAKTSPKLERSISVHVSSGHRSNSKSGDEMSIHITPQGCYQPIKPA